MDTDARVLEAFLKMRIKHDRLDEAHRLYNTLRQVKRSCPREPQRFGALFAPTQSGKSMSVTTYIETVVVKEAIDRGLFPADMDPKLIAERQKIALHVTLSSQATPKSLASDILEALGDPCPDKGTAQTLRYRAYKYMRHFGTEICFIDEIQHLSHKTVQAGGNASRSMFSESTAVTDMLKCMLLHGLVPLVFIGIPEGRSHLFTDDQLSARCVEELDFGEIDYADPVKRQIFIDYCGRMGIKLQRHGLFEKRCNLLAGDLPACLHAVAGGRLGMASNLTMAACKCALRLGADELKKEHFEMATDGWAIPRRLIDYNPFRNGIREIKIRAA
ncbi:ATP-binding protein [Oricola sp.]|uniref:ATP-binding protein n=1 Tax=Oricola sp. TaxID=1979950 RepID=UPI003513B947